MRPDEPLIARLGDIREFAQNGILNSATGGDGSLEKEAMTRKLDSLFDELAGPTPTPLERILCERVALCYLDTFEMDRRFGGDQSGRPFREIEYRERRRGAAPSDASRVHARPWRRSGSSSPLDQDPAPRQSRWRRHEIPGQVEALADGSTR